MPTQRKQRQLRSADLADEAPTINRFMDDVVSRTDCPSCNVGYNDFCFEAEGLTESKRTIWGICNDRSKRAGYNHPINPLSLTRRPYAVKS